MRGKIIRLIWAMVAIPMIGCGGGSSGGRGNSQPVAMKSESFLSHLSVQSPQRLVDSSTRASIDGRPVDISAIDASFDGSIATIRGTYRASGSGNQFVVTTETSSIDIEHALVGQIESIDANNLHFTAMGQRVYITDLTRIYGEGTLTDLAVGERVSVGGFASSSGEVIATIVKREPAADQFVLRGILKEAAGGALRIGDMTLDLTHATFTGLRDEVGAGQAVLVTTDQAPAAGTLVATALRYLGDPLVPRSADSIAEFGIMTARPSPNEVYVGGRLVDCSFFHCETLPADLPIGALVQAYVDPMFRITPYISRVNWGSRSLSLVGPIDAIDVEQSSFTVLGFRAQALPSAEILSMQYDEAIAFGDLRIGDTVSIYAGAVGNVLATDYIARSDDTPSVAASTAAFSFADPELRVAGRTILTSNATAVDEPCGPPRDQLWLFDHSQETRYLAIQVDRTGPDQLFATNVTATTEASRACD